MQTGFPLNLELPEDDEFFDDKADILEINGLSESQEFVLTSGEEPSPELLAFLRLINLSGASLQSLVSASCLRLRCYSALPELLAICHRD